MRGERFRDTELKISVNLVLTGFRTPQAVQLSCNLWSNWNCARVPFRLFHCCCNNFHCVAIRCLSSKNTSIYPQAFRDSPKYPRHLSIIQGRQFRRTHELPVTVPSRQASHGCVGKHHLCIGWCWGFGGESHKLGTTTSALVDQGGTF